MTTRELYDEIGGDYDDFLDRIPMENIVEKFVRKYAATERYEELYKAYDDRDYAKVFEVTHNLKGMAANVSLTAIGSNISEICEAVRHGEPKTDIGPLIEKAREQHEKLKDLVEHLG